MKLEAQLARFQRRFTQCGRKALLSPFAFFPGKRSKRTEELVTQYFQTNFGSQIFSQCTKGFSFKKTREVSDIAAGSPQNAPPPTLELHAAALYLTYALRFYIYLGLGSYQLTIKERNGRGRMRYESTSCVADMNGKGFSDGETKLL
jgi:hypothetical protein